MACANRPSVNMIMSFSSVTTTLTVKLNCENIILNYFIVMKIILNSICPPN
jgi:hypothetical protein